MNKSDAVPGPGTYRLPSDFGYLELKKWHVNAPASRNAANSSLEVSSKPMVGQPYQAEMSRFMQKRKSSQLRSMGAKSSQGHRPMRLAGRNRTIDGTPQKFAGTRTTTRGQGES